jgi:hypothetical protein
MDASGSTWRRPTGAFVPVWLPAVAPEVDLHQTLDMLLMPCLLIAVIGGVLALERPGPRRTRVRWVGKIPIEEVIEEVP